MIFPTDKEYKVSKSIFLGKKAINEKYKPLKDWISKEFTVDVINIVVDCCKYGKSKDNRIQIILKTKADCRKFENPRQKNGVWKPFDTEAGKKVSAEINLNHKDILKLPNENVFVVFSAFERVAIQEIHDRLPKNLFKNIKNILGSDIWDIRHYFSCTYVMCYKNEQVSNCKNKYVRFKRKF